MKRPSKPVSTGKTKIHNPAASTVRTTSITPFAALPAMEPVRPKLPPKSRQIVRGPNVVIIGKDGI